MRVGSRETRIAVSVVFAVTPVVQIAGMLHGLIEYPSELDAFGQARGIWFFVVLAHLILLVGCGYAALRPDLVVRREIGLQFGIGIVLSGSISAIALMNTPVTMLVVAILLSLLVTVTYDFRVSTLLLLLEAILWLVIGALLDLDKEVFMPLITVLAVQLANKAFYELLRAQWSALHEDSNRAKYAATELANANVRLQNLVVENERKAMVDERSRIAREIHDTVGHTLSSTLIQLRTLKVRHVKRDRGEVRHFEEMEHNVEAAINEMRREVSVIRAPGQADLPWTLRWHNLSMIFSRCTGIQVRIKTPERPVAYTDEAGKHIFRVIQEALTNSVRHGSASLVDIVIAGRTDPDQLTIRISDNGVGSAGVTFGNGLTGISERVRALGGTVEYLSKPNRGFDIGIDIPIGSVVVNEED